MLGRSVLALDFSLAGATAIPKPDIKIPKVREVKKFIGIKMRVVILLRNISRAILRK